jgi:hypothetical protein
MDNFDLRKYLAEGRLLKEDNDDVDNFDLKKDLAEDSDNSIEEESILNEYEHSYEEVNGKCRRYNDEGEYTIVSMNYCR